MTDIPCNASTSRYRFSLATEEDERDLRHLLRETPVEGSFRVAFEREPHFFAAAPIQGKFHQVAVVKNGQSHRIIGMGTRSVAGAFINGEPCPLGYLGDLRLLPEYRRSTLATRGYRLLRDLHDDGKTALYYTVIFSDNVTALNTIAAGRAGLPKYHDLGALHCPGINLLRRKKSAQFDGTIVRGNEVLLPQIVECLNRNNCRKQFAPVHSLGDFALSSQRHRHDDERWVGFDLANFYVAMRDGQVIGVLGKWDLRTLKQSRVLGYAGHLRWIAPLLRLLAPLRMWPRLPRAGEVLPFFYASFIAIDNDDIDTFKGLLRKLYNDSVGTEFDYFLIAFHERDPLRRALADYKVTNFSARLFCVCFEKNESAFAALDGRCPYIELATL